MVPTIPFPKHGVKVSFFRLFIDGFGGIQAFEGKTTTDVNETIIKPMTRATNKSACEYIRDIAEYAPNVAIASGFISHARKYKFLDVVSAIEKSFDGEW